MLKHVAPLVAKAIRPLPSTYTDQSTLPSADVLTSVQNKVIRLSFIRDVNSEASLRWFAAC